MLTSRERSELRAKANGLESIFQIGKSGVTPELVKSVNEALEARELVKGTVLNNCMEDIRDIAERIGERTKSDVVQIIGRKIVFYRKNEKKNDKKESSRR